MTSDGGAGEGDGPPTNGGAAGDAELVHWSGSIGNLCGDDDQRALWLVMSPDRQSCAARSVDLATDGSDFVRAELPGTSDTDVHDVSGVAARYCTSGSCRDAELALALRPEAGGMRGTFTLTAAGAELVAGAVSTARCAWDDYLAGSEPVAAGVRGLSLQGLAAFQAVKVPLMELGRALTPGRAGIVAGRPALFRAYVEPAADWLPRPVRAKLSLVNGADTTSFDATATLGSASDDAALDTTFDFAVPAEHIRSDTRYALELFETTACAADGERSPGRFPETGTAALGANDVGGANVEIVPVRIRSSAGDLLPDTSPAQIARLRDNLFDLFPLSKLDVHVRPTPLDSTATSVLEVLDAVSALREDENADRTLSYYGLFQLTETLDEYCTGSCVLGAGIVGDATNPMAGSAVGVGYTGDAAARTFAHELGHVYGRQHSPCNIAGDPDYPYSEGRTGVWGYSLSQRTLIPPTYSDVMGYCQPYWISDYVFGHLASFIQLVNEDVALSYVGERTPFRTILLERGVRPRLGRSRALVGRPPGKPETAVAYTPSGRASSVVVHRAELADTDAELVYLPDPVVQHWSSVRLARGEVLDLDAAARAVSQ